MNRNVLKAFSFTAIGAVAFLTAAPAVAANWIQYNKNDNPGYWLDLDSVEQEGNLTVHLIAYGQGADGLAQPTYAPLQGEYAYDCDAGVLYHHPKLIDAPYVDTSRWEKYFDDNDSAQFMAVCRHIYQ